MNPEHNSILFTRWQNTQCSGWNGEILFLLTLFFSLQNFQDACYLVPGDYCYWWIPSVGEVRPCSGVRPRSFQWSGRPTSATTSSRQVTPRQSASQGRCFMERTFLCNIVNNSVSLRAAKPCPRVDPRDLTAWVGRHCHCFRRRPTARGRQRAGLWKNDSKYW